MTKEWNIKNLEGHTIGTVNEGYPFADKYRAIKAAKAAGLKILDIGY